MTALALDPPLRATSPVAVQLAAEVAPVLVVELEVRKFSIIALAGGVLIQWAVRVGWGFALRLLPMLVEVAIDAFLDRFGKMSFEDLAAAIVRHNTAKGHPTDPRIVRCSIDTVH